MPDETLGLIQIEDLIGSSTNPRRDLNGKALEELTSSVRTHGVLQPILVRRLKGKVPFEIVAGHRRFAAAKKAGLEKLPAFIRELTDKEVLEIQLIENVLRSDLHPLEEADGYRLLVEKHGYTVEQLADRVAKSKGYVYARMKLGALAKGPRAAFLEGKLDASTALLIARMPEQLQAKALKEILDGDHFGDGEPMSYRAAAEHVRDNFMLKLAGAPFDPKDAGLVKAAGACGACPKRTGNQPELFGDVKSADVCTDPICFKSKGEASWRRRAAEAQAAGREVIEGSAAKRLFPYQDVLQGNQFLDLGEAAHEANEHQKTYAQVLGKKLDPDKIVLARSPQGQVHELVKRSDLPALLKAAGVRRKPEPSHSSGGGRNYQAEEDRKRKIAAAVNRAMVAAVMEKAASGGLDKLWPIAESFVFQRCMQDIEANVLKGLGVTREKVKRQGYVQLERPGDAIERHIAAQPAAEREALRHRVVLQLMLATGTESVYSTKTIPEDGPLVVGAKIFGVKLAAIAEKAKSEFKAKKAARKAKKK